MESVRLLTRTPSPARVEERGFRVELRRRTRLMREGHARWGGYSKGARQDHKVVFPPSTIIDQIPTKE